jgi:hypothetical protein
MKKYKTRKRRFQKIVKFLFDQNNLIFIAAIAVLVAFATAASPFFNINAVKTYILITEILICFVCITLILISLDLKYIKKKVENNYTFKAFNSGEEFDDYLSHRLNSAKQVCIIHFSSTYSNAERKYVDIVDRFVDDKKGIFKRIIADSTINVYKWNYIELVRHRNSAYFVFLIDKIKIPQDMRTMGVMIIDDNEVCLGGGYQNFYVNPTISIQNKEIVRFYKDYYDYLLTFAIPTRNSEYKIDDSIFKKTGVDVEKISKMNAAELDNYRKDQLKSTDC